MSCFNDIVATMDVGFLFGNLHGHLATIETFQKQNKNRYEGKNLRQPYNAHMHLYSTMVRSNEWLKEIIVINSCPFELYNEVWQICIVSDFSKKIIVQ